MPVVEVVKAKDKPKFKLPDRVNIDDLVVSYAAPTKPKQKRVSKKKREVAKQKSYVKANKTVSSKRKRRPKIAVTPDNSYKFDGTVEKLKFEFSKTGYPYLDFEEIRVMPFNVSFDLNRHFTFVYINFMHSSLRREFTTAGITSKFGIHFRIPSSYTKHFSKKEKIFLQFLRSYVSEMETVSLEELQDTELEWNKPKIEVIDIGEEF